MSDIAIRVENLSKYYNLGVINSGTLSRDLQSWLWKKMGKEDPNRKIGVHEDNAEGFWALKDLNFEIKKGERVGIIGKNGAGKSTLLKMLSQISAPTEGRIYINGKVASLLEVGTGFNPELTGRENIYLNGAILGMKKREVDRKIDEIIAFSEIERHIDTPVKRYSSGMYVRLAFAVAAHLDSDILIADEVLAVGDAAFQKKALGKMNELSTGQGRTVLFVSHNMNQILSLCNHGIVLDHGHLLYYEENINTAVSYYLGKKKAGENSLIINENSKNSSYTVQSIEIFEENGCASQGTLMYERDYNIIMKIILHQLPEEIGFGFTFFRNDQYYLGVGNENNNLKLGLNMIQVRLPRFSMVPGSYGLEFKFNGIWSGNSESYKSYMTFTYAQTQSLLEISLK